MIKQFFEWLISIYYKPAIAAENQTSGVTQMSEPLVDASLQPVVAAAPVEPVVVAPVVVAAAPSVTLAVDGSVSISAPAVVTAAPVAATASPLAEFLAKVEAFGKFVEHGIEVLGAEAEAELVALKDKYL